MKNLIREIGGLNKYIAIAGFKNIMSEVSLINTIRSNLRDVNVQFFNAKLIAGWEHLFFAALNALRTFESKMNISNSFAVETLLYAASTSQIKKAMKLLGINSETSQVAVLVIAETQKSAENALESISTLMAGVRDDSVIDVTEEKMEAIIRLFNISDQELKSQLEKEGRKKRAVINLVIEHVALLITQR